MRALLKALAAALLLVAPAAPAWAQLNVPPPKTFQTSDRNGVDLLTGTLTTLVGSVSIGPQGAGGLSNSVTFTQGAGVGDYYRHSLPGGIQLIHPVGSSVHRYTVTLFGESFVFTPSGSTFILREGQGGTLTASGGVYTFTSLDGTVATFTTALAGEFGDLADHAGLDVVTRPSGEVIDYHYTGTTANTRRLRSVTNTFGYQIHFLYDGSLNLTGVEAINNAIDPCDPVAAACPTFSQAWPTLTYGSGGWIDATSRSVVTSPAGVVWPSGGPTVTWQTLWNGATGVDTLSDGSGTWTYDFAAPVPDPPLPGTTISTNTVTDPLNNVTQVKLMWWEDRYQDPAIMEPKVHAVIDPEGNETVYGFDGQGRPVSVEHPEGDREVWDYNARGDLLTWSHEPKPSSGAPTVEVEATYPTTGCTPIECGRPVSITDAEGNTTDFTYDSAGNVLTVTGPEPTTGADRPQTRNTWVQQSAWYKQNGVNSITQAPTPVWVLTETSTCAVGEAPACLGTDDEVLTQTAYEAGASGVKSNLLPITVTTGAGDASLEATVTTAWTRMGDPDTVDGPLSGTDDTTWFAYDAMRRPLGSIGPDPDGGGAGLRPASRTVYNADAQPETAQTGTATALNQTAFDAMTVLSETETAYNAQAFPVRTTLTMGATTYSLAQTSYDSAGQVTCVAQRMNPAEFSTPPSSACTLDAEGDFGPDRIVLTEYDDAGRVVEITTGYATADARTARLQAWTENGQVAWVEDGEGNRSGYAYDGLDRLIQLAFPSKTQGAQTPSTTDLELYEYDLNGNRTQMTLRTGEEVDYVYDALNRQTTVTPTDTSVTPAVSFTYDNLGRVLTVANGTQTVTNQWDALGRKTEETTTPLGTLTSAYDLAGRRTSITWPGGWTADYTYDLLNRVTVIEGDGALAPLAEYAYDDLGRRTAIQRGNGVDTAYGYTGPWLSSLGQDLASTASDVTFAYARNPAVQIVERASSNAVWSYIGYTNTDEEYVPNGLNQYATVDATAFVYDDRGNLTDDGVNTYSYDLFNRLLAVDGPVDDTSYLIDPLGRMAQETSPTGGTRRLLYDGDRIVGEYNTSGSMARRYVPGPGVDEVVAYYFSDGTTLYQPITDERGSVIAYTASSGNVTGGINTYDDFGQPDADPYGRFQYTGQARLTDTPLYYYKARVYHPGLGRFLQTDPIGYVDSLNLYAYVLNDPINGVDPTGLCGTREADYQDCVIEVIGDAGPEVEENLKIIREAIRTAGNGFAQDDPDSEDVAAWESIDKFVIDTTQSKEGNPGANATAQLDQDRVMFWDPIPTAEPGAASVESVLKVVYYEVAHFRQDSRQEWARLRVPQDYDAKCESPRCETTEFNIHARGTTIMNRHLGRRNGLNR